MGRWTLPGGKVEAGERLHDALRREMLEETGLEVQVGGLAGHLEIIGDDHHLVILDFHATLAGPATEPYPGDDVSDAAWMGRAELEAAGPTDDLFDFLDRYGIELAP